MGRRPEAGAGGARSAERGLSAPYPAAVSPCPAMSIDWKTSPWTLVVLMALLALVVLAYRLATGL